MLRPSAAYGYRACLEDIGTIADLVRTHPHGAHVSVIGSESAPWQRAWLGLALSAGDLSVLLPVIGEWPLGPGRSTLLPDLEAVMPADLLPALVSLSKLVRDAGEDGSFIDASESMRRILKIALAYITARDKALFERIDRSHGIVTFEFRIEDDGAPALSIKTSDQMERAVLPAACLHDLTIEEPLLLFAGHRDDYEMADACLPSIILKPLSDGIDGASLAKEMPSAMEILRILDRWPPDDASA